MGKTTTTTTTLKYAVKIISPNLHARIYEDQQ